MKAKLFSVMLAIVGGVTFAGPAAAIVIKNGTSDSDYINLANSTPFNSVGQFYGTDSRGGFAASGVLIAPNWVLTAAHVTTGASSLNFYLDSGGSWNTFSTRPSVAADRWYSYPQWNGNLGAGYDLGLVHLSAGVSCAASLSSNGGCAAQRYTGTSELGQVGMQVGFGMTGTGSTGATTFDGLKRAGQNMIDGVYSAPGGSTSILLADFDSGLPWDNSFGSRTPLPRESMIASGDSGGGLFEFINGQIYLTGITSFGLALDGKPNSDYGDIGGWTRITQFNSWIDSVINQMVSGVGNGGTFGMQATAFAVAVPEPETYAMMLAGLGLLGFAASRRKQAAA